MNKELFSKGLRIVASVIAIASILVGAMGQAQAQEMAEEALLSYGYGGGPDCSASVIPPRGGFSFKINNGEYYTWNREVTLTMKGGNAAYMQVSNYSNFWGSSIQKYATSSHFWLTYGEGNKTVYVKFFNACKQRPTGTISRSIYSYAWW
jgi:hypothetical protein